MNRRSTLAALLFGATVLAATDAQAVTNLMFILDSSGSMWGKVDDQYKIDTAKSVLSNLLADLPQDSNMGLMVYGHRNKSDCNDVETVMRLGSANEEAIAAALTSINPLGKTPLTLSLQRAGNEFGGRETDNNNIVLISDGKATCGGDPCAAAAKLAASGINVKVHVVGFDISADDQHQLECIADQGKGRYFNAKNTSDFKAAVKEVTKIAQQEPPATPPPAAKPGWNLVFEDNFDGTELAEHWTVTNPNPEAFVVENGELLLLSTSRGEWNGQKNTITNFLTLDRPLPKGDWRATMRFRMELGTSGGYLQMGMLKDVGNRLIGQIYTDADVEWSDGLKVVSHKYVAGKDSGNDTWLMKTDSDKEGLGGVTNIMRDGVELRLLKEGRSYTVQARMVGSAANAWISLPKLTSLRPVGPLHILFEKGKGSGEDLLYIDRFWVEQLTPKEAAAPTAPAPVRLAEKKS